MRTCILKPQSQHAQVDHTKVDLEMQGERRLLQCPKVCTGRVEVTEDGAIDASRLCPPHLLLLARETQALKLGVEVSALSECPLFSDIKTLAHMPGDVMVVATRNT